MESAYRPCPQCGLPNIRERHICKRCRANIDLPLAVPVGAATDQTGHLYRDATGRAALFIVPAFVEYAAPGLTIRSVWANVQALERAGSATRLRLAAPAAVSFVHERDTPVDPTQFQLIPLTPFGYPANPALRADLARFAPHLRRQL